MRRYAFLSLTNLSITHHTKLSYLQFSAVNVMFQKRKNIAKKTLLNVMIGLITLFTCETK